MNHSLGYGTSSGDLNTGGNLSESSFLEALFGLEFGHADFADDADFLLCCLLVPQISRNSTDFCPMRAGISLMKRKHPTPIFWGVKDKCYLCAMLNIKCYRYGNNVQE